MSLNGQSARVPIGYATLGGQQVPVYIDTSWYTYLVPSLTQQVGGTSTLSQVAAQVSALQVALAELSASMVDVY